MLVNHQTKLKEEIIFMKNYFFHINIANVIYFFENQS